MVKIGSKKINNEVTELTIEQFEKLSATMNNSELDQFEKWAKIFIDLGADENEVYDLDFEKFTEIIKDFCDTKKKPSKKFLKSIELDGYTYQAYEDEFKLNVRDLKMIEKAVSTSPENYISRVMAIIFKRTDLTKAEHYADAHLTLKSKLFKQQKADIAIAFISYIGQKLGKTAKEIQVEATEIME
jgi:MoaA/NifB/PqqE/SkfB family radical SAM enzyme